jgi:exopolysaccharide production protein ExoZ
VIKENLERLFEVGHGDHRQIRSMEGLRGLAVCLVFLVHYVTLIEPWLMRDTPVWYLASSLRGIGHAGVDLFFVLSGYLIYGTLIIKARPILPYLHRRVQRIYPVFLAVFILYLLLSWLFPHESKIPAGFGPAGVYLTANLLLLPGIFPIEPMITVAWSLSYEVFYYLTVPLLIALLGLRERPRIVRVAFFSAVAVLAFGLAATGIDRHVRLVMFIAGILLYETLEAYPRKIHKLGLFALVAGLILVDRWVVGPARYAVLFVVFYLLCQAAFRGNGLTTRMFCWTPLRWLGNMSYSYYLIHGLALKAVIIARTKLLPPAQHWNGPEFWILLVLSFALTLVPAGLLFAWIERPFSLIPKTSH